VPKDGHPDLAGLAVDLLTGPSGTLVHGAEEAMKRRLAGLFLYGLRMRGAAGDGLPDATAEALRRSARHEAADDAVAEGQIGEILHLLARRGLQPVVLKGRLLAQEIWPQPHHRPPGDLDLLLDEGEIPHARSALVSAGFVEPQPAPSPETSTIGLGRPPGRGTAVDLHWRPFRTVGKELAAADLLGRARPATLAGHPVRTLEETDRLLYLLIHAAKHGMRRTKWLLDLYGVAMQADEATWQEVVRRAIASRNTRPCFAAAAALAGLPGLEHVARLVHPLAPGRPLRAVLSRLVSLRGAVHEVPPSQVEQYALELVIEDHMPARFRRGVWILRKIMLDRVPGWR
jgi:hypothetical protein